MIQRTLFQRFALVALLVLVASIVLAACGDEDEDPTATTGAVATATEGSGQGEATPTEAMDEATATGEMADGTPTEEMMATPTEAMADPTATEEMADPTPTEEEMGPIEGTIDIDGSSTVFPITQAVAEEFNALYPDVQTTVGFSGTGGGFEKFCAGETQISNASRPIREEEIAACEAAGIEFVELYVAIDGLSVVVNPANDWVTCLTVDQLIQLWGPESTIENWNQLDPSYPDMGINFYSPGTDSGTFDYFTNDVLDTDGAVRQNNITLSEDDNVLVQGVVGDEGAIGYFGYAYYIENEGTVKAVEIDGGEGCVAPTPETVQDGTYQPLSRPLFVYVATSALEEPAVYEFIRFYLTDGTPLVSEVGYVELSAEDYAAEWAKVEEAMGS